MSGYRIHHETLAGVVLGVSIAADEDTARRGFGSSQVNDTVRRISESVLGMGGGLVFGHDWRTGGVMDEILNLALDKRSDARGSGPPIQNFVPWPDRPSLSEAERERFRPYLAVREAGLPAVLAERAHASPAPGSDEAIYLRARGLSHLREQLTAAATARLCIGGRRTGSAGLYAGILEEARLALRAGQPLYVTALFGGAAALLADAIDSPTKPCPGDFAASRDDVAAAVAKLRGAWEPDHPQIEPDPEAIWREFNGTAVDDLARHNGLDADENRALLRTDSIQVALHLVLRGLVRTQIAGSGD